MNTENTIYNNISEEEINTTSEEITETEENTGTEGNTSTEGNTGTEGNSGTESNTSTEGNTGTENQQIIASNDVDKTNIINEENGYYNYQNGLFQSIDTAKSTKLIPCNPGEIYYVTAKSKYAVAMVIYYDKDKNILSYSGLCPSVMSELNYEEEKIVIPRNCYYVVFQTHTSGELCIKHELDNINYTGYFEKIDCNNMGTGARHYFDPNEKGTKKLLLKTITPISTFGQILALEHWQTDIFECSPGDRFLVSSFILCEPFAHFNAVAIFVDKDMNVISYVGQGRTDKDIIFENTLIIAPENAKYVAFNSYRLNDKKGKELEVKKFVSKKIPDNIMGFDLVKYTSPLYGKRIYADGDSIAQGGGAFGTSYADIIAKKYNMILTKNAVGGTTLAIKANSNDESNANNESNSNDESNKALSIYERVTSLDPENKPEDRFDFILLDGGGNDMFSGTDPGALKEGYDLPIYDHNTTKDNKSNTTDTNNTFDAYTTIGATEAMCKFLNTHYPNTPKLFILIQRIFKDNTDTNTHFDGIKSALEKWEIPYIDLREETILANWDDDFTYKWFEHEIGKNKDNIETIVGDGTHPNRLAYEKFYVPIIEAKLKTLSL